MRSERLVADILEAAARVLARDGARRFTTARVAETAGVSIGSLYQYFPNKEAILFRLQADEWRDTTGRLQDILDDRRHSPAQRLRTMVSLFVQSECEEADLRVALRDAAPYYRDAPQAREHQASSLRRMSRFMGECLPSRSGGERKIAAELVMLSMGAVGKIISEQARPPAEIKRLAAAMGDMFCAYLEKLDASPRKA